MPKLNNFLDDFRKDHLRLLRLIVSFCKAVEASSLGKAEEILCQVNALTNGHFNFEETYLYPRLRRLILEITQSLCREQETVREFISKSRSLLKKDKLSKNELSAILKVTPRLSRLFEDCNDLSSLATKFSKEDKEDLNRRFRECCGRKSLAGILS